MRNLKRALSLGLASSMVLGTMAFGVSGYEVSFNDADKINLEKQVAVVNQIGLMLGDDDGNFNPESPVTRAEMAVICTTMLNGAGFHASQFVGTAVFTDVPEWCQDYVNLAASLGIVAGRGDGIFAPNDTVTTAEAMLMILKTLGYYDKDDSRLNDELISNWSLSATRQGTSLNLYDTTVDGDLAADQPLNRENVASICFRALTDVVQVDYNPSTSAYYNYGGDMQWGVNNTDTASTLGYKYFLKLHAANDVDQWDRPSVSWMYDGQEIDNYTQDATHTYVEPVTGKEIYTAIGSAILNNEDYDRAIYVNGEVLTDGYMLDAYDENGDRKILDVDTTSKEGFNSLISNSDTTTWLESGNGVLTEIFVTDPVYVSNNYGTRVLEKSGEIIISMIHTYIATVDDAEDLGDGTYKYYVDLPQKDASPALDQFAEIRGDNIGKARYFVESTEVFLPGDVVRVKFAESADAKTYDVVSIEAPDVVNGDPTESNGNPSSAGGRWMDVDGERFFYSYTSCGNIDTDEIFVPTSSDEVNVYFDEYGYALGYSAVVPGAKYLYVEEKGAFNLSSGLVRVTLEDGTEKTITVSEIDNNSVSQSNWGQIPAGAKSDDRTDENVTEAESINNAVDNGLLTNRIFGYVELSDGTYRLTTSIRTPSEPEVSDGGNADSTRPYQINGVLPGMESHTGAFENYYYYTDYDATVAPDLKGVQTATDGNFFYTPREDSMFIYDSIHTGLGFKITSGNARVMVGSQVAFLTDNSTVFIDVVNGGTWVGYDAVGDIGDTDAGKSDLNMQVVFGKNGYADYVFINSGISADSGNYVIIQDNNRRWFTDEDGADMYEYTVYDLNKNEEVFIYSKDVELVDHNGKNLERNDLYRIASQNTDAEGRTVVKARDIQHYYGLDQFADYQYGSASVANKAPMTAAYTVGDGTFMLDYVDAYDKTSADLHGGLYTEDGAEFNVEPYGYFNNDDVKYETALGDYFTVNSSTQIIKLVANNADDESIEKFTISPGSLSDIKTVDQKGTTWVDVVSADGNNVAKVVLVIRPFGYDDTNAGQQGGSTTITNCPATVWKIEPDVLPEGWVNGSGSTPEDASRLAGWIDVSKLTTYLSNLTQDQQNIAIAQRLAKEYALTRMGYVETGLDAYVWESGSDWQGNNGVNEYTVRITGTLENGEELVRYVSFIFGPKDENFIPVEFDKELTDIIVATGIASDFEIAENFFDDGWLSGLDKDDFDALSADKQKEAIEAEVYEKLEALLKTDEHGITVGVAIAADGTITVTLTAEGEDPYSFTVLVGEADQDNEGDDVAAGQPGYTGFNESGWSTEANAETGNLTIGLGEYVFSEEEANAYYNKSEGYIVSALVESYLLDVLNWGEVTTSYLGAGVVSAKNEFGDIVKYEITLSDFFIPVTEDLADGFDAEALTAVNDYMVSHETVGVLTSLESELAITVTDESSAESGTVITLSGEFVYAITEDFAAMDNTAKDEIMAQILVDYAEAMGATATGTVGQMDDTTTGVSAGYNVKVHGVTYTLEIAISTNGGTGLVLTELDMDDALNSEAALAALEELGFTVKNGAITLVPEEIKTTDLTLLESAVFDNFVMSDDTSALPDDLEGALLVEANVTATYDEDEELQDVADELAKLAARKLFKESDNMTLISVSTAYADVNDLPRSSEETYYAIALYMTTNGDVIQVVIEININIDNFTSYTVKFEGNGATETLDALLTDSNKQIKLPEVTRAGYTFAGWFNGTSEVSDTTTYGKETTLTAKWTFHGTITFAGLTSHSGAFYAEDNSSVDAWAEALKDSAYTTNADTVILQSSAGIELKDEELSALVKGNKIYVILRNNTYQATEEFIKVELTVAERPKDGETAGGTT